jgi:hypothetical protein
MHLSLKGSLKSSLIFTYVKTDQALDLGNLEPFTIPDLSGNANTATLYSGIYVSTNGTTDKAIAANATALGSGNYYLTGKIKPAGTTAKTTMDGSTASNLTGLTAGVWQDFQTATASAITPSSINLGWDGTAFNATVDNWSDVKLHDASDDSVVAHYKLYDSADASLDGYPALDCVGGFHGAHVGCAGGSGEGVYADVAGISATLDDKMWFDGVDDYVEYSPQNFTSKTINAVFTYDSGADVRVFAIGDNAGGSQLAVTLNCTKNGNSDIVIGLDSLGNLGIDDLGLNHGDLIELSVTTNASKSVISGTVNGVAIGATDADNRSGLGSKTVIGTHDGVSAVRYTGIFFSLEIEGDFLVNNTGATDADWEDQIGSNNGTVNGSPVTVGQKRETILQTAGEDFNKRMWFDGGQEVLFTQSSAIGTNDFRIKFNLDYVDASTIGRIYQIGTTTTANGGFFVSLNSGAMIIGIDGTVLGNIVTSGVISGDYEITFIRNGNATLTKDGAAFGNTIDISSKSAANLSSLNGAIGNRDVVGDLFLNRAILSDLEFDYNNDGTANDAFDGFGNTNNDWLNTVTANNGTVNGSPTLYHVAESETTAGQDALGTAIVNPRPNERVLNLTTGTGYAEIADSASLDLTTAATWELWGNFYELFSSSESLLSKWSSSVTAKRSWIVNGNNGAELNRVRLVISANGSNVSWIGYVEVPDSVISLIFTYNGTIVTGYVNGASVTVTTTFGSIPASMHVGTAPLYIGTDNDSGTMLLRQIGDIRIYDRALTADEVLKNYNARKGAYGL